MLDFFSPKKLLLRVLNYEHPCICLMEHKGNISLAQTPFSYTAREKDIYSFIIMRQYYTVTPELFTVDISFSFPLGIGPIVSGVSTFVIRFIFHYSLFFFFANNMSIHYPVVAMIFISLNTNEIDHLSIYA